MLQNYEEFPCKRWNWICLFCVRISGMEISTFERRAFYWFESFSVGPRLQMHIDFWLTFQETDIFALVLFRLKPQCRLKMFFIYELFKQTRRMEN